MQQFFAYIRVSTAKQGEKDVSLQEQQSRRFLLEQALKFYFQVVVPSQGTVRPEVLAHYRQSAQKNRKLLQLLAQ